jgi:hypothetical protein
MAHGRKVDDTRYQEIVRLKREEGLGAHTIAKRLTLAKGTVQTYLARYEAETAHNGHGQDSTPAAPALEAVPLDQIHLVFDTQARVTIDSHLITEYAEAMTEGATFPPVVLFRDAEGYWVGDGHHRCQAAKQVGYATIKAEVRAGDDREAFLYACAANATHGLRRDDLDKRHVVMRFLMDEEWGQWSDREIARRCAVSHPFVGKIRAARDQLRAERAAQPSGHGYQIEAPETRTVQRGASTYTMDTTHIGTLTNGGVPDGGLTPETPQRRPRRRAYPSPPPTRYWYHFTAGLLQLILDFSHSGGVKALRQVWTAEERRHAIAQFAERMAQLARIEAELSVDEAAPDPAEGR